MCVMQLYTYIHVRKHFYVKVSVKLLTTDAYMHCRRQSARHVWESVRSRDGPGQIFQWIAIQQLVAKINDMSEGKNGGFEIETADIAGNENALICYNTYMALRWLYM